MVHLYTSKDHSRRYANTIHNRVKILCTKRWIDHTYNSAATIPHNVTCPKCLEILIPREAAKLETMKRNYERENQRNGSLLSDKEVSSQPGKDSLRGDVGHASDRPAPDHSGELPGVHQTPDRDRREASQDPQRELASNR